MKLTFITDTMSFELGIIATGEFFKAIGAENVDSLKMVDDEFLKAISKMETTEFSGGFTEDFKEQFLHHLKARKGKYIYIDDWLDVPNIRVRQKILDFIDKGFKFSQALAEVQKLIEQYEKGENKIFDDE